MSPRIGFGKEETTIPTRKEVAERAGVSEATVSRVLNGVGPVREKTRRRVLEAAEALGYRPNAVARNFALGRSGHFGVVVPHIPKVHLFSTHYFSELLSGIGEAAGRMGYGLLLLFRNPDERFDYETLFREKRVDALLVLGSRDTPAEREELLKLRKTGAPFCLVSQYVPGERLPSVDADHVSGARAAVRHLVALGCRRIAFLNGPAVYSNSRDRLIGYRAALEEAGIAYDPDLVVEADYSRTGGARAAEERIAPIVGRLDAVFAANDRMAIGLVQVLKARGVAVGRDLAVVGYDDSDDARLCDPPLSTVRVPLYEMGRAAAERVLRLAGVVSGGRRAAADRSTGDDAAEASGTAAATATGAGVRRTTGEVAAAEAASFSAEPLPEFLPESVRSEEGRWLFPAELVVRASSTAWKSHFLRKEEGS